MLCDFKMQGGADCTDSLVTCAITKRTDLVVLTELQQSLRVLTIQYINLGFKYASYMGISSI